MSASVDSYQGDLRDPYPSVWVVLIGSCYSGRAVVGHIVGKTRLPFSLFHISARLGPSRPASQPPPTHGATPLTRRPPTSYTAARLITLADLGFICPSSCGSVGTVITCLAVCIGLLAFRRCSKPTLASQPAAFLRVVVVVVVAADSLLGPGNQPVHCTACW